MTAYRDEPLLCPSCRTGLEPHELEDAVIDTCPSCAGLWIDWHDGELASIARRAPVHPGRRADGSVASVPLCPRCRGELAEETFVAPAPIVILRCPDCAGAFVERDAASALVAASVPDYAEQAPQGMWARLVAALKDLMFGNASA